MGGRPMIAATRRRIAPVVFMSLIAACSSAGADASARQDSQESSSPRATPSERATPKATPRPTPRATPTPNPRADLKVAESGYSTYQGEFDDGANLTWAVVVDNPNPLNTWLATSTDVR